MTEETGAAAPEDSPAPQVAPAEIKPATPVDTGAQDEGAEQGNAETPTDAEDDGADDGTDKPRRLSHVKRLQRKVSYQVGELAAKDERIAYLESIVNDAGKPEDPPQETGDFFKDEAAKTRWELKQELREGGKRDAQRELDFQKQSRMQAARKVLEDHGKELASQIPDYEETIGSLGRIGGISEPVKEIFLSNPELGARAAYFLGKQPDLAAVINRLSPTDAAFEIGQLLGRSSLPQPKKQTSAPTPMRQPHGGAAPPRSDSDLSKNEDASALIDKWRSEKRRA